MLKSVDVGEATLLGNHGTQVPTSEKQPQAVTSAFALTAGKGRASDTRNKQKEGNKKEWKSAKQETDTTETMNGNGKLIL